ncbi:lipoxygenase homology domain-containing protein 1-like [Mixophyes fleayi]|uniref:lipoxygenase homology domain-containing protein 1-like n=1 Tax=Mixophyes fleayi TaxID=3061075 RepID=UPI003F4E368A
MRQKRSNSAPFSRSGLRPGSTWAQNVLYKVVVKTGEKKRCGTNARVYIQMKGTKGKLNKTQLSKKSVPDSNFTFAKGSTHTFKVYGPEIGDITNITLQHDGLEQQHAWYVDDVFITNTNRDKSWHFPCRRWFSLYHTDCQLSRVLTPVSKNSLHQLDGKAGDHTASYFFKELIKPRQVLIWYQ